MDFYYIRISGGRKIEAVEREHRVERVMRAHGILSQTLNV